MASSHSPALRRILTPPTKGAVHSVTLTAPTVTRLHARLFISSDVVKAINVGVLFRCRNEVIECCRDTRDDGVKVTQVSWSSLSMGRISQCTCMYNVHVRTMYMYIHTCISVVLGTQTLTQWKYGIVYTCTCIIVYRPFPFYNEIEGPNTKLSVGNNPNMMTTVENMTMYKFSPCPEIQDFQFKAESGLGCKVMV